MRKKLLTEDDYKTMGLPQGFWDANWAWMVTHGLAPEFERYLSKLHLAREKGIGLFIGGNPSCGKSYAAAVVGKAFRQNEYSVQWLEAERGYDLLSWNRDYHDPEYGKWMNRVMLVDLLIIDNFGSEKAINRRKIMLDVVKQRALDKLPTVVTTRMNPRQLQELYEESTDFMKASMKNVSLTKHIDSDRKNFIQDNF